MGNTAKSLEEVVRDLPPHLQREVRDFADFLVERAHKKPGRILSQDWGGALRRYRDQFTSLELQKKTLEWRGD